MWPQSLSWKCITVPLSSLNQNRRFVYSTVTAVCKAMVWTTAIRLAKKMCSLRLILEFQIVWTAKVILCHVEVCDIENEGRLAFIEHLLTILGILISCNITCVNEVNNTQKLSCTSFYKCQINNEHYFFGKYCNSCSSAVEYFAKSPVIFSLFYWKCY